MASQDEPTEPNEIYYVRVRVCGWKSGKTQRKSEKKWESESKSESVK